MKAYIVLHYPGEYEEPETVGAYSTPEQAAIAAKLYVGEVREFEMDTLPDHPEGQFLWRVTVGDDGELLLKPRLLRCDQSEPGWEPDMSSNRVHIRLWAENEDAAVAGAAAKVAELKASGEWTTDWDEWWEREGRK